MGLKRRDVYPSLTISRERLATLRALCLGLPDATEKMAWGDPTWRVGGKIFAMQKGNYNGGRPSVWFKAADGAQQMLVEPSRPHFFVPPYVGNKGWVGVYLDGEAIEWGELENLIAKSCSIISGSRRV